MNFNRHNKNLIFNWWWSIDRYMLSAIMIIIAFSAVMVATASPAIADRIGLESFYFIRRQLIYLLLAIGIIFVISSFSLENIRRLSIISFLICIFLLIIVLFSGTEIKGARRWIQCFGLSIQPSEFTKPFFAVLIGWVLSQKQKSQEFPIFKISIILYLIVVTLLILQPDFGMVVTISLVWGAQLFLAGLPLFWIFAATIIAIFGVTGAYIFLPHVNQRINNFIDPAVSENYQIKKSLEAFSHGGLYGRGPGEGTVKQVLPDSHCDFIFAVIGEELGIIVCLIVLFLFAFIVIRGFFRILTESDSFIFLSTSGLLMQFGMQSVINMGVTLNLFPTKGMTLPFVSYGGSSMLAIAVGIGIILAMTKKRIEVNKFKLNFRKNIKFQYK
ncbi:MAG: putative lipid II flippase FtsW [Alphaproteobacteria bacterium]